MGIRSRIGRALEKRFGLVVRKPVRQRLLGREFQVLEGTFRPPDYDDAWLLALALRSQVVFDVGCNIGQSGLLILHSPEVRRVLLIDPNPSALAMAAENLILNNDSPRATFVPAFVSNASDEKVEFFTVGQGAAGSMYRQHAHSASDAGASLSVATVTLDDLMDRFDLTPDLVKIDVESAEVLVLEGATRLAERQKARFLVEMHSSPMTMEENGDRVLAWCRDHGYEAWYLKEKIKLSSSEPFKSRGRCHLLLVPAGRGLPEYLQAIEQGAALEAAL